MASRLECRLKIRTREEANVFGALNLSRRLNSITREIARQWPLLPIDFNSKESNQRRVWLIAEASQADGRFMCFCKPKELFLCCCVILEIENTSKTKLAAPNDPQVAVYIDFQRRQLWRKDDNNLSDDRDIHEWDKSGRLRGSTTDRSG